MFCTGGIRCEKATAFMLKEGWKNVYHLKGGILKYLEEIPQGESLWNGDCFVFDQRVSIDHDLNQGTHVMCLACGRAVNLENQANPLYELGVQCPDCVPEPQKSKKSNFRERARQVALAEARGVEHIGATFPHPTKDAETPKKLTPTALISLPILYSFRRV